MGDEPSTSLATLAEKVPEGWRKRVAAVVLQLAVGTRKGADLYYAGRDAIDTAEGRSIVARELANAVAKQAVEDPKIMERAKARFLGRVITEQENVEAVLLGAGQLLLSAPAPASTADVDSSPNGAIADIELDQDWVESFTREAEKATTEGLRERMSRILAGEIATPGRYPRSVFRKIVELEKEEVSAIQRAIGARLQNQVHLGLLSDGDQQAISSALAGADLLDPTGFSHGGFILRESRGDLRFDVLPFGDFGLAVESTEGHLGKGNTLFLNRAGMAAFDLIGRSESDAPARAFAERLATPNMRITLCGLKYTPDKCGFNYSGIEVLHAGTDL